MRDLQPTEILLSDEQIRKRVAEMAVDIRKDFPDDLHVIAASDWLIDMGPGAGDEGGRIVVAGPPDALVKSRSSRTAPYLARFPKS